MVVQIRGGVILLLASSRLRVTVGDPGEVVHQPQGRVVREQQTPHDRLYRYARIVTVGDSEEVVHQPQGRVVREQQTPPDRLHCYAHIVTVTTQESAGD